MTGFSVVSAAVLRDPALSPGSKGLYALLCSYADTSGLCWPSVQRLATDLSISDRSVKRLLSELVNAHAVSRTRRPSKDGRRSVSVTRVIASPARETGSPDQGTPVARGQGTPVARRTRPVTTKNEEQRTPKHFSLEKEAEYEGKVDAYLTSLVTKEWAPGQSGRPWYGREPASTTLAELGRWANNPEFWGEPLRYFYDERGNTRALRWFPS